jgi:hypothetical protein
MRSLMGAVALHVVASASLASADDECVASPEDAAATVGCNGPELGGRIHTNDFGSVCTPGGADHPRGSCRHPDDICFATLEDQGICLRQCPDRCFLDTDTAAGCDDYVYGGGCPSGSRCFQLALDLNLCFPDCTSQASCTTHVCDEDGACAPPTVFVDDAPAPRPPAKGGGCQLALAPAPALPWLPVLALLLLARRRATRNSPPR